jgi:hypothetical protein
LLSTIGAILATFLQPDSTARSWKSVPNTATEE